MNTPCWRILKSPLTALALLAAGASPLPVHGEPAKLPGYAADLSQTSISGLSSGGFMAAQYEVAFSQSLVGAGIVAGGPFYCSGSYSNNSFMQNATTVCMNPLGPGPDPKKLLAKAKQFAKEGKIDSLDGLHRHKVYLFSGKEDKTVTTKVVNETLRFLQFAGVPEKNIRYVKTTRAGHALVTSNDNHGACEVTAPPFINDCDINQAQDILRQLYGSLNPPSPRLGGQFVEFNQREFIASDRSSMDDRGYAYVPADCEKSRCKVHVAMHGCQQGAAVIGDRYYKTTGYNEIADANQIIVLYPQVKPSDAVPLNPRGCWDFWGYSSPDPAHPNFFAKDAPQLQAINRMVQRLGQARQP